MIVRLFTTLSLPILMTVAAVAAEPAGVHLEAVSGKVLVNQGKGFAAGRSNVTLKAGTKIMVGENSGALLVVPESDAGAGCQIELKPASVTRVAGAGMCDTQLGDAQGLVEQPIITPTAAEPSSIPPEAVALGFVAIAAGAAVYTFVDNDNPTSPP
jgi:hypothetical protein